MTRPSDFVSNPPWVTEIIADSYETLEDTIPPAWLPRLSDLGATGERLGARVVEYGCGVYGCVIPTVDAKVVLKLTTDMTEAEFAAELASDLVAPICVTYHMVIKTRAKHKGNRVYLLWRDAADHVGKMAAVLGKEAVVYLRRQHRAGQLAFEAAMHSPGTVGRFIKGWLKACESMATQTKFPELQPLGAGLIEVWNRQHIVFGDIHEGNVGVVDDRWVITDPGNIAVVNGVDLNAMVPHESAGDVILKAQRTGRPSQRKFVLSGAHVAFTDEVVDHKEVVEYLYDAMPAGFHPGPYFSDGLDFSVIRGMPEHDGGNKLYIVTPRALGTAPAGIFGAPPEPSTMQIVADTWAHGEPVDAILVAIPPDGSIYVLYGREALQLAAADNRQVVVIVKTFDPGWHPPDYMQDISQDLIAAMPRMHGNTRTSMPD